MRTRVKIGYTAVNKYGDTVDFYAYSTQTADIVGGLDAQNWIINHLDLSEGWKYHTNGKFKFENAK